MLCEAYGSLGSLLFVGILVYRSFLYICYVGLFGFKGEQYDFRGLVWLVALFQSFCFEGWSTEA